MEPNFNQENESNDNVHELYPDTSDVRSDNSLKSMLGRLTEDFTHLWDKENLLVRSEINEKLSDAKDASKAFVIGGGFCFAGLIAAVSASIFVLDIFMPLWLSAVIVTAVFFLVGGVLIGVAKKKMEVAKLRPRHSIETLGEIKNTLRERVYEFRQ